MNKTLVTLATTAAMALATSAYAADAEVKSKVDYKKDGGYEATRSAEKTTSNGTKISSETDVDVDVDSHGRVDKTVKVESKADAKGLMNAKKDKAESTINEKENGGYKQTESKSSSDAAGTDTNAKATTDVDVDKNGNVTSTETVKKSVDPKGLLNEKTSSSKRKTVNGVVVEEKTSK